MCFLQIYIFLQINIFASAERKFNTIIPSLGDTLTLMQVCFKNIRDVDKKIRLLEFYVFGNVTVSGMMIEGEDGVSGHEMHCS